MPESRGSLFAIEASRNEVNSSSQLVRDVANDDADLAAVWDGTYSKFVGEKASAANAAVAQGLVFVPMPYLLPNDLLVCSRSAPAAFKERIRAAIRKMSPDEIGMGDFRHWVDIDDAKEAQRARAALSELRQMAAVRVPPVTVDVRPGRGPASETAPMVAAARHAVRLSGTEFVLYDEDFHKRVDMVWVLDAIHDGASRFIASLEDADVPKQVFPISFRDADDLTRRIVDLVRARLHRVRYVWPYSGDQPRVIRDLPLPLTPGSKVDVQRITWLDPERNSFNEGTAFKVRVSASSLFVHELEMDDFEGPSGAKVVFNPMSNVTYRVYQLRIVPANTWFRVATGALVGLLMLAAVAAFLAVRRRRREMPDLPDPVDR